MLELNELKKYLEEVYDNAYEDGGYEYAKNQVKSALIHCHVVGVDFNSLSNDFIAEIENEYGFIL